MSVVRNILRSWRAPRAVVRQLLAIGKREDRALAYVMGACIIIFVSQWPALARQAHLTGQDVQQLISYSLLGWVFVWPLLFYGIGAISHLIAKALGGKGTFYGARVALFWALLASTPAALLYGLLSGFVGQDTGTQVVGALWLAGFGFIWLSGLKEAENGEHDV